MHSNYIFKSSLINYIIGRKDGVKGTIYLDSYNTENVTQSFWSPDNSHSKVKEAIYLGLYAESIMTSCS